MESLAAPQETTTTAEPAGTAEGPFMSLADAVANCQVKAKKTIVRWAKAEGIGERYGRTGAATIERVVPVDWVQGKMREKGLPADPIYEPVEMIENVSFTRSEGFSPLGSKVPALFEEDDTPQILVFFERLKQSQESQALQVRTLIHESRSQASLLGKAVEASREEGRVEIRRFRRAQTLVNVALCAGVFLVIAGIAFVVHLGFHLNATRAEEVRSLKRSLAEKLSSQEEALKEEIHGIKQSSRTLRTLEEQSAEDLAGIRQGIGVLREDLGRRDEAMESLLATKDREMATMRERIDALVVEKQGSPGETPEGPPKESQRLLSE